MLNEENIDLDQNKGEQYIEEKSNRSNSNNDEFQVYKSEEDIKGSINHINLNDSLKLYENQLDSKNNIDNHLLGSEEIFINQRIEIEKMKKKNELFNLKKESKSNSLMNTKNNFHNSIMNTNKSNELINNTNNYIKENEAKIKETSFNNSVNIEHNNDNNNNNREIETFSLNDYQYFKYSVVNYNNNYTFENEDAKSKIINFDNNIWNPLNEDFPFSYELDNKNNSYNYMEINNIALKIIKEIDYDEKGLELKIDFNLVDDSELWIFTRTHVNKSINESNIFDKCSANVDFNDIFNKYSSLIKIIKDITLNRWYITFGTFYHEINENNKLFYKSFLIRQLIDYSNEIIPDIKNIKSEFNLTLYDLGEETINVNVFLNNKIKSNEIKGNFFLPINKKAKILICGKGKSVQLKNLVLKFFDKKNCGLQANTQFEMENENLKNCECCCIS